MRIVTAKDIVKAIDRLPKNQVYYYVNPRTKTILKIVHVALPEGPITIKRWDPGKGQTEKEAQEQSVSTQMIWRIANAVRGNIPINFDRVLGGSYNTRSALEALMAHTSEFYVCRPGRIESISSSTDIKKGHKHLVWKPDQPHKLGFIKEAETDIVISEIPGQEVVYDSLGLPSTSEEGLDIEVSRRHAQIQIALIMIGQHLGYRTWVAKNDMGIIYKQKRLVEMEGVIPSLTDNTLISAWQETIKAALFIDVIWFKNARLMPAVIEIEHTSGVTSGLTRMKKFQDVTPSILTNYVIAAADEDRGKVMQEISQPQFRPLDAKFFPYSAVEELWALCERRKIQGVTEEFLASFIESSTSGTED